MSPPPTEKFTLSRSKAAQSAVFLRRRINAAAESLMAKRGIKLPLATRRKASPVKQHETGLPWQINWRF
jgi:hypothetical protein